jgi:PleD family two-component response regulator
MSTSTRVLVADVAEMDAKIRECLPGHDLTFVRTMYEAISALRRDGFQLVVIGLEFDESRMLELLQYVRGLPKYKDIPVVCVHADHLNLSEAAMKNIDVAVKALGGMAFINLADGAINYRQDCRRLDELAVASASLRPN